MEEVMKKKVVLLLVVCSLLSIVNVSFADKTYSKNEIYRNKNGKYIKAVVDKGFMYGKEDGTFGANDYVTKADALYLIANMIKNTPDGSKKQEDLQKQLQVTSTNQLYIDTSTPLIINGKRSDILNKLIKHLSDIGIKDIGINLDRPITKQEFAYYMYLIFDKYDMIDLNKIDTVADIENSPYKSKISLVVGNKILLLDKDKNFKPYDNITRGEIAKIISDYTKIKVEELPKIKDEKTVLDFQWVSQLYPVYAPIGCEPTSVYAALKSKGYVKDISHRQFLDNMPYDSINPNRGFVGHYTGFRNRAKRETIFPNALAKYAKIYSDKVEDISGASMEDIKQEIYLGNPVVVYVTLYWNNPIYRNYYVEGNTYRWLSNNHVVTICGYDPATNMYYVSDPLSRSTYKYWVNGKSLEYLYNFRKHAIVVR